jgi:hypothetical protein
MEPLGSLTLPRSGFAELSSAPPTRPLNGNPGFPYPVVSNRSASYVGIMHLASGGMGGVAIHWESIGARDFSNEPPDTCDTAGRGQPRRC